MDFRKGQFPHPLFSKTILFDNPGGRAKMKDIPLTRLQERPHYPMGQVSRKLRNRLGNLKASYRNVPIFDARRPARSAGGQTLPIKTADQLKGYHPIHAIYLAAQNLVSYLAEEMSGLPALREYSRIVGAAEDEYRPDGPPMSPLTASYFTTWALFDATFGPDRETIGTCLSDIGPDLGLSPDDLKTIRLMQQSRMGIYEHQGVAGDYVHLRELVSGRTCTCRVPAGYLGQSGELWYARVLPSPIPGLDESLVFTTPYKLVAPGKAEWLDFLNRTMPRTGLPISRPAQAEMEPGSGYPALDALMKYGLSRYYWHEFIFQAYHDHRHDVILLMGLPDVPESLPHSSLAR
jgi:hypothetical protein